MTTIPSTMRAITTTGFGGAEVLELGHVETPKPGPGDVLISVHAAGVNRPDIVQRQGAYPPPPGASDILGLEVAGRVVALGADVGGLTVGDQVCALVTGGGYAEYCVAPRATCLAIPDGLSSIEAAAIPETFFTVWSNVFDRAKLKSGETFLVHGGTSGIGTTAIQLAKAFGAKVFTTAGSDEKCQTCKDLGADLAINYKTTDFVDAVKEAGGADVILDMVGGSYLARNIKCLKADGRHVSIAFLEGAVAEINFMSVMMKRLTLTGSTLRARDVDFKAAIALALIEHVWPLMETGKLGPLVDSTFPLAQAREAHRLMESNAHKGKIVLEMAQN